MDRSAFIVELCNLYEQESDHAPHSSNVLLWLHKLTCILSPQGIWMAPDAKHVEKELPQPKAGDLQRSQSGRLAGATHM